MGVRQDMREDARARRRLGEWSRRRALVRDRQHKGGRLVQQIRRGGAAGTDAAARPVCVVTVRVCVRGGHGTAMRVVASRRRLVLLQRRECVVVGTGVQPVRIRCDRREESEGRSQTQDTTLQFRAHLPDRLCGTQHRTV